MTDVIVVGVDASDSSHGAVKWSARLAAALGMQIEAVHVESHFALWELSALQVDFDPYLRELQCRLDDAWTQPIRDLGVCYRTQLLRGDPSKEIMRVADEVDAFLVVVGAQRHFHDHLIGGTAHKLVNRSRHPVVLVPPDLPSR
jgi:nucleotide-binding universal stress UspA family protein